MPKFNLRHLVYEPLVVEMMLQEPPNKNNDTPFEPFFEFSHGSDSKPTVTSRHQKLGRGRCFAAVPRRRASVLRTSVWRMARRSRRGSRSRATGERRRAGGKTRSLSHPGAKRRGKKCGENIERTRTKQMDFHDLRLHILAPRPDAVQVVWGCLELIVIRDAHFLEEGKGREGEGRPGPREGGRQGRRTRFNRSKFLLWQMPEFSCPAKVNQVSTCFAHGVSVGSIRF